MKSLLSLVFVMACGVAVAEEKDDLAAKAVLAKLERIAIPEVDFENTSVEEAIDFARICMAEHDPDRTKPERLGISFLIRRPKPPAAAEVNRRAGDEREARLVRPSIMTCAG